MERRIGFAAYKREPRLWARPDEVEQHNRDMLSRVLSMKTAVAFVGAGCSIPLGYPTWNQFTLRVVQGAIKGIQNSQSRSTSVYILEDTKRLEGFGDLLEAPVSARVEPRKLMSILGMCQKLVRAHAGELAYRAVIAEAVTAETPPGFAGRRGPYDALLDLPISRFVTSNYDHELASALGRARRDPGEFTQKSRPYDQLTLFAMARLQENTDMVFHCHGSSDDPDSMVVTESDYQRWYLRDDTDASQAFHQTINLLFSSNPILFIGYGLGDDDLMRPLRILTAVDGQRTASRPLFALLSATSDKEEVIYHQMLADRYGVKVISYAVQRNADHGDALRTALEKLNNDRIEWRDGWLQKPRIHAIRAPVRPPVPCLHHLVRQQRDEMLGTAHIGGMLDRIEAASKRPGVIVLLGLGGTGKSWYASKLLERVREEPEFQGFFFWSSYYSDDSLTGLDRLLSYLDPDNQIEGSRPDRLLECLRKGRYFIVFDGVERLMRNTGEPEQGRAHDWVAQELFKIFADRTSKSTVVLTTRLWPTDLGAKDSPPPHIELCPVPRLLTEDLRSMSPFSKMPREQVSGICSLLDGHAYAATLAARYLEKGPVEGRERRRTSLKQALARTPFDRRVSRMIRETVEDLDRDSCGLASEMLSRLSLFMRPIQYAIVEVCYNLATSAVAAKSSAACLSLSDMKDRLMASNLLTRVDSSSPNDEDWAYTLHPVVRQSVYDRIHHASTDAFPNFTLPGFTAGTSTVDPGSPEAVEVIKELFSRLCDTAEQLWDQNEQRPARDMCRAAFSVLRSRMESNTCSRWGPYNDYLRLLSRLGDTVKKVSPGMWDYAERHDIKSIEHTQGPLSADELAWLYNEIGLVSYGEGSVLDAVAVWEQGYEINRVIGSMQQGGQYDFQAQCNLGAVYIHLARLKIAEQYIREAVQTNREHGEERDLDHAGRLKGYLGVVYHLRGNLDEAGEHYGQALETLKKAGGNSRAESVFFRHYSDLTIERGDYPGAAKLVDASEAKAREGRFFDLVAFARVTRGHCLRKQGHLTDAVREYNIALSEARRLGIRRLEAEILSELSRLALDLGDMVIARQRAMQSLAIANELHLGLRQTHGLVILGKASCESGDRELGLSYLRHAKRMADQQQYWLRFREAERLIHHYGGSKDDEVQDAANQNTHQSSHHSRFEN